MTALHSLSGLQNFNSELLVQSEVVGTSNYGTPRTDSPELAPPASILLASLMVLHWFLTHTEEEYVPLCPKCTPIRD